MDSLKEEIGLDTAQILVNSYLVCDFAHLDRLTQRIVADQVDFLTLDNVLDGEELQTLIDLFALKIVQTPT